MNQEYRKLIADEFRNCVDSTISRITNNEQTYRPFHTALLSQEAVFGVLLSVLLVHPLGKELLSKLQNWLPCQMVPKMLNDKLKQILR